jgi:hypothetical protein
MGDAIRASSGSDASPVVHPAEGQASQWKSIDSAPKDGSPVLAIDQNGDHQVLSWRRREPYGKPIGDSKWRIANYKHFGEQTYWHPTHWMPLPAKPSGEPQ